MPALVVQRSQTSSMEAWKIRSSVTLRRAPCAFGAKLRAGPVRVLEGCDVELLHLQHGFQRFRGVPVLGVTQHLAQSSGDDLPRETESILQPTARPFLASVRGQCRPQPVDLLLRLARHHERDSLGEREGGSAVEGGVLASVELEHGVHQRALGHLFGPFAAHHAHDLGVVEEGDVEIDCLLGPLLEDQTWCEPLPLILLAACCRLSTLCHLRLSLLSWSLARIRRRRSSSTPSLSSRDSHTPRYAVIHSFSSQKGSGRSA